jgi:hypothetical protein
MGLFLAGGSGYTRRQGLRRLKERLENVPGASNIRYEPSAIKPTAVVVDVDALVGSDDAIDSRLDQSASLLIGL